MAEAAAMADEGEVAVWQVIVLIWFLGEPESGYYKCTIYFNRNIFDSDFVDSS